VTLSARVGLEFFATGWAKNETVASFVNFSRDMAEKLFNWQFGHDDPFLSLVPDWQKQAVS
jgi:hypothetical protein